jgi:hypothetical protein
MKYLVSILTALGCCVIYNIFSLAVIAMKASGLKLPAAIASAAL